MMLKKHEISDSDEIKPLKKVKFTEASESSPTNIKKSKKNAPQQKDGKKPPLKKNTSSKLGGEITERPEDWNVFKKERKALKLKRKQNRSGFDVIVQAKKLGEKVRCKLLKGGEVERNKLINELHMLLKGQDHYAKFVTAHDTSRIVQWLLKYGSDIVKEQISKELIPVTIEMLKSKYGIHCVKRLLKYGSQSTKQAIVTAMYGKAVKLTSHALSAPVFEYAYSTWATPKQKIHLVQEFFSDMYRNSKDDNVKHLRHVYESSTNLKAATLSATKANLQRILNKNLLDSGLVQTVLCQYLSECSDSERSEMISLLVPHIVVLSNSKDGARAAMQCIWHGTNKDRKTAMKTLKEHVLELAKHEHGHCTVITLIDAIDDTVLLHKLILHDILSNAETLAVNEWGRKVLLWLVAPSDQTCFHPLFIRELDDGLKSSTTKKSMDLRRKEILQYASGVLLNLISSKPEFWLSSTSLAYEMLSIVKAGISNDDLANAYKSIAKVIVNINWMIKVNDKDVLGIEDAGLHMTLKKLGQHDKINLTKDYPTFGDAVVELIEDEALKLWIGLNRGCFILIAIYEHCSEDTCNKLKEKLQKKENFDLLKQQKTVGGKILLKKFKK